MLVCARGGGSARLRERQALASQLWAAGVRAELMPGGAGPNVAEAYEYAAGRGIKWIAIVDEGRCARHTWRLACHMAAPGACSSTVYVSNCKAAEA